jgi:hypothetical protein
MRSVITANGTAARTATLVDIREGVPVVQFQGAELGPVPARTIIASANRGDTVLLMFDEGDAERPIIVGVVRDRFDVGRAAQQKIAAAAVLVEGSEEVTLRCGESSLTLRKDGKAVLKGSDVVSRASRSNRIKGSTVQIN